MSYQYEPTKAEERAAALLREKGWRVSAPECPECHGFGFIPKLSHWGDGYNGTTNFKTEPCPRGCPTPSLYYSSTGDQATWRRLVDEVPA